MNMQFCCNRLVAIAMGLSTLGAPMMATAGGWEVDPEVTVSTRYNDNPTLQPEFFNPISALSGIAILRANISTTEANSAFELRPRIQTTYYPEKVFEELNRTDWFLNGSYNFNDALWAFTSGFSYDKQSVISSEDSDPTDPGNGGSGNFFRVDDTREQFSFSPGISYRPTLRDTILLNGTFSSTDHKLDFTNRADFDTYGLSFNYQRALSNRHSVGFFATAYTTDSSRIGAVITCDDGNFPSVCPGVPEESLILIPGEFINDSDGNSFNLSYSFDWTENTQLKLNFGRQETDIISGVVIPAGSIETKSSFKSNQYLVGITSTRQLFDWEINASRSVQPNSNGTPSDKIQLQAQITTRHTPKLSSNIAAIGFRQTARNAAFARENEFVRLDMTLTWRINRDFSLNGTYIFRNRDPEITRFDDGLEDNPSDNAVRKSNSFTLALRYKF